ncbi:HAD domain-containing protein [Nocardia sp. XZ_19_385]|uniref:HAD domain-containing protein n=1 Tax=Nocardia sp. XZ_19_385 TaxID=2769488 RepID=UPI0028167FE5|nr:HAD domain-containing protein [Nocardia sp. XZ_19_385]
MTAPRPLLFLDVDGPLIPFGGTAREYSEWHRGPEIPEGANPLLVRVDPAHGPRLAALPCELVWATTWTTDANELICPRLGLPEFQVVLWPEFDSDDDHRLHWKTRDLVDWAAGRPFVWVDDEITEADRSWVAAHHPAPALLHRVDPRKGLAETDFVTVAAWLAHLS